MGFKVEEKFRIILVMQEVNLTNGLRLGEGCLTYAQFSHETLWQLLPNRCYMQCG